MTLLVEPTLEHGRKPVLPSTRGPLSRALLSALEKRPPVDRTATTTVADGVPLPDDCLGDDDLQLSLHVIYELSYRGFEGVDDRWERAIPLLGLRHRLEDAFERALRVRIAALGLLADATSVEQVLGRFAGPSLSQHMAERGTAEQFREFAVHRSAYQLKEADPHSWAIPRFGGPRKAALVEIQSDEYGGGEPGRAHADLFADVLRSLDLDSTYGAYLDRLPGSTLATGNLISMLGMQHRLRAALIGHLAAFELTSVQPMTRYASAAMRLGLDEGVLPFYLVHIEADDHHGALASSRLVGGVPEDDGLPSEEICFGAAGLLIVEDLFARHLLRAWAAGESSLRPVFSSTSGRDRGR